MPMPWNASRRCCSPSRATGTHGYKASIDYVIAKLEMAGYEDEVLAVHVGSVGDVGRYGLHSSHRLHGLPAPRRHH